MAKDYLLMFLEKRIFTLKAGDDTLLDKLRAAVGAVVEGISGEPRLVVPFTLIALDPLAPIDDPVFEMVGTAVQDQWNTYTEVFPEPRTLFRAVLLDALARAAEDDVDVAGAVDLICRNILPHIESGGEAQIITRFRDRARELAQAEAERKWPSDVQVITPKAPTIRFGPLSGKKVSLDRDAFKAGFARYRQTGHWVNDISAVHNMIVTTGADTIFNAIESVAAAGGVSPEDLKKNLTDPLLNGFNALVGSVTASLESAVAPLATLKTQSDLLWWKEAAYSEHLQQSYREISLTLLPLISALDFAAILPSWSPLATENFLAEAVWRFISFAGSKTKKVTLSMYLEKLASAGEAKSLIALLPVEVLETSGRSTLLAFAVGVIAKKNDPKQTLAKTGLSADLNLSEAEICLAFFREIQALRLLSGEEGGDSE